jgi:hypothetical protein
LSSFSSFFCSFVCAFSSFASWNEGPNFGTNSKARYLTPWNFLTLSYHFLARSDASSTNCWVTSILHPFVLDMTNEFHLESVVASTWCIYTIWMIGYKSCISFFATDCSSKRAFSSLFAYWIWSNFYCFFSGSIVAATS